MNRGLKMVIAGSGMTNYQIELKAGIPLTKLSRIIHGAAHPSEAEKANLAKILGKSEQELFPNPSDPVAA